ncbi:nucleotide sugar dehydrogenase [Alloiococcus sp. CFN-8]|uniref:nucleotide sugar dehydrogenase n=1 Tax=Alloiococcus sp. CFN-8 TaxID=3416081 RepID=UPI003CEAEEAB
MKNLLLNKIYNKEIIVAVVGLGYVGLPLAVEKAKAGFKTLGFDIQEKRVAMVNKGYNYIGDVVSSELSALVSSGFLSATTDYSDIAKADFIAICVPSPLDKYQQPDMSYIKSSAEAVAKYMKKNTMVVLESTTYPGTTEELLKPILENGSGFVCGRDFYLGYSPERVDPGNLKYKTKNTPKVVGAIGEEAAEVISAMYGEVLQSDIHVVSSPKVAEMEKLLENTYRNVNIALVNELAILCHKMNINIWEVIEAAKTKPYGFQPFYPGPGLGGHCIPLDPYYLAWKAREYGFHTSLIEASGMINDKMPEYCVERAAMALNSRKLPLKDSRILVLGVAYKEDIDDYRESPALKVIELLIKHGASVSYYDPYIKAYLYKGEIITGIKELTSEALKEADLTIITTSHRIIDYAFIQENSKLILDTKNAMGSLKSRENIILL